MKKIILLAFAVAATLASSAAFARVFVGIGIGVPVWGPGYYYPPYYGYPYYGYPYYGYAPYYEPAPVVVRPQQQRYVEQPQGMWYYCADSKAYYPYVKDCPAGWQRVSPTPR